MSKTIGQVGERDVTDVLYMKLGPGGMWEPDCIRGGTLRLGYEDYPHELCLQGRWDEVLREKQRVTKDQGAATRAVNQVRLFYEAPQTTVWITFHGDRLWWCVAHPQVTLHEDKDNSKLRHTIDGWRGADVKGTELLKSRLSGKLLAVQGFQGTICSVQGLGSYLMHKINGTVPDHIATAQSVLGELEAALLPLIQNLSDKDFEIFTDLIFRQAGWQRTGVLGGSQKDTDIELLSPVTGETIAVQVKAQSTRAVYENYQQRYSTMQSFKRFYFITHTPTQGLQEVDADRGDEKFIYWGPSKLARFAARYGLADWLLNKSL